MKKILLSLDTSKVAEMDQIPEKILRGGAEVLAFLLKNVINLSIKLSTFPEDCKIAKLKPVSKKVQGLISETIGLFHFCCQYQK